MARQCGALLASCRSLNGVIDQMEKFSSNLNDLASKVEATHHTTHQGLEMGARQRDEQLRGMCLLMTGTRIQLALGQLLFLGSLLQSCYCNTKENVKKKRKRILLSVLLINKWIFECHRGYSVLICHYIYLIVNTVFFGV